MIEIIKRGSDYKIRKRKAKCELCGCEFTYQWEDERVNLEPLYSSLYVMCPCCNNKVVVIDVL